MGIQDFSAMFDVLDPACKGYITGEQLQQFHEVIHFNPISLQQVEAAIGHICGFDTDGIITRDKFIDVLLELDRRRAVEERAFWDFQALDSNGDGRLPLTDALLLFRETQGDQFILSTWENFLRSREFPTEEVCFDEIRLWLCVVPGSEEDAVARVTDDDLRAEEEKLLKLQQDQIIQEYDSAKHWQESMISSEKENEDYLENTHKQADRKRKKWEREGVEALLFDDGQDVDGATTSKPRNRVTLGDLYECLEQKYDLLRQKLVWEMVSKTTAEGLVSTGINTELMEMYRKVDKSVKQLWKMGYLAEKVAQVQGSQLELPTTLVALMGELYSMDESRKMETKSLHQKMISDRKSKSQADDVIRTQYEKFIKGKQTCGDVMLKLLDRMHQEKKDFVAAVKIWQSQNNAGSKVAENYFRLVGQTILIDGESNFVSASTVCGLVERTQTYKSESYDWDRTRMEKLALQRLLECKGRRPIKSTTNLPLEGAEGNGSVDMQDSIVKTAMEVFAVEREIFMDLLQGRHSLSAKTAARNLSAEERQRKVNSLRTQRKNWRESLSSKVQDSQKLQHCKLLQQAMGLVYEERCQQLMTAQPNVSEDVINASILADLQQKQHMDLDSLLEDLGKKDMRELEKTLKQYNKALKNGFLDNAAFVLLGSLDLTDEERRYIEALDQKYELIRETILLHTLKYQHGAAWKMMSKEERYKELRSKKKEEKRLRGEGRREDMVTLLGSSAKEMPSLRQLMGENKEEFSKRQEDDEPVLEKVPTINPLADLVPRYEAEQNHLLTWLRSPEVKVMSFLERRKGLVELMLEKLCGDMETDYESLGYRVGLTERLAASLTGRHHKDEERQGHLAMKRCNHRQQRLLENKTFKKESFPKSTPTSGDQLGWLMLYLNQVIQRHLEEREMFLQILQDETLDELREATMTMTDEEKQKRFAELQNKRRQLDMEKTEDREESLSILEEAAAIRTVCKKLVLEKCALGRTVAMETVTVNLMVELQTVQDRELVSILQTVITREEAALGKLFENEVNARHWEMVENVVFILTKYEGQADDDQLLQALEEKYDALRDKLLAEALMKEMGETEWRRLSEQERQRRIAMMKLKERQLRKEGNLDELAKLLGDHELAQQNLRKMMGENRAALQRKLEQRRAERDRRRALGEEVECEEDGELDEDSGEQDEHTNILDDLDRRYEEERDALIAKLRGMDDQYLGERERQAELVRLRRERRRADREDNFDNAALVLGLAERQQQQLQQRLKNDRQRQEMLAKERLEKLRQKKGKKGDDGKDVIVKTGERTAVQEAVMELVERKHGAERELFCQLMSDGKHNELHRLCNLITQQERDDKLAEFQKTLQNLPHGKSKDRMELLQQGTVVKMESRRSQLALIQDGNEEAVDVCVSLMADLQDHQDMEAERILNSLSDMDEASMIRLQEDIVVSKTTNMCENIIGVVFSREKSSHAGEEELLSALDGKYDALRDKLLIEALMNQAGEAQWQRWSEQERQRRLLELKLKERKLRQENNMDELANILGQGAKDKEALTKLLGETREDQMRKMKEKLEKRRQRLAQGLTEEECDKIEQTEEEEEKQKPRNILLDLQQKYDQEKEELLRRLHDSDDKLAKERQRQLELARLRRDQRKVRQEEKFESAALVLGLARESEAKVKENMEEERRRQEKLAHERLAARRKQKQGKGQPGSQDLSDLGGENYLVSLQESVTKEIEARHQTERDLLMQMFQEIGEGPDREKAGQMSEQEQRDRLTQLQLLYNNWRNSTDREKKIELDLLKGALVVQLEQKQTILQTQGQPSSGDDQQVALLADLQQLQDTESRKSIADMENKGLEELRKMQSVQSVRRSDGYHDNLAQQLLGVTKVADVYDSSDEVLIDALDQKYQAVKYKLYEKAVLHKLGADWWNKATSQEKQSEIVEIQMEENGLRDEGKSDEADLLLESRLEKDDGRDIGEKRANRKSVLDNLTHQYEDEKAALLASLHGQEDRHTQERQRQLSLAKLRRDRRRLELEEKFDSAALLLSLARDQERELLENLDEERKRQLALAQERLAARRNRKQELEESSTKSVEENLLQQDTEDQDSRLPEDCSPESAIFETVERKHCEERDVLYQLLQAAEDDKTTPLQSQSEQDLATKLEECKVRREQWLKEAQFAVLSRDPAELSTHSTKYLHQVAENRTEQYQLLKNAVLLRTEVEIKKKCDKDQSMDRDQLQLDFGVELLADLQEKQTSEMDNLQKLLMEKQADSLLDRLKSAQHTARTEGWFTNLSACIFSTSPHDDQADIVGAEELDRKFKEDTAEVREKAKREGQSAKELEAMLADLQLQYDAQSKALDDSRKSQQQAIQERLKERRRGKSLKDIHEDEALHLLLLADSHQVAAQEVTDKEKNRQNTLMQERLAARRAARKAASTVEDDQSRPSTVDSSGTPSQRQKTPINVEVTDDQKQAMYSQLVHQQSNLHRKITEQQSRQEEMLQRRLEQRKGRRQEEAAALFSLGERQKTFLEKSKKDERERQISVVRDRVARVKYERTVTMRDRSTSPVATRSFEEVKEEAESEGISIDEKMVRIAREMETKFKDGSEGKDSVNNLLQLPDATENQLMTDQARLERLKQRRAEKRKKRQAATTVSFSEDPPKDKD